MRMAARKTLAASLLWALALGSSALCPLAPARAEPFLFFWDRPERAEPEERPGLTWRQVRGILAREGARMTARPHFRGDEIVAIGVIARVRRKGSPLTRSPRVLDIQVITGPPRRSRLDERPRDRDDFLAAARPLRRRSTGRMTATTRAPPNRSTEPSRRRPRSRSRRKTRRRPGQKSDDPDSALSPIKPLHPAGAPKVEPCRSSENGRRSAVGLAFQKITPPWRATARGPERSVSGAGVALPVSRARDRHATTRFRDGRPSPEHGRQAGIDARKRGRYALIQHFSNVAFLARLLGALDGQSVFARFDRQFSLAETGDGERQPIGVLAGPLDIIRWVGDGGRSVRRLVEQRKQPSKPMVDR